MSSSQCFQARFGSTRHQSHLIFFVCAAVGLWFDNPPHYSKQSFYHVSSLAFSCQYHLLAWIKPQAPITHLLDLLAQKVFGSPAFRSEQNEEKKIILFLFFTLCVYQKFCFCLLFIWWLRWKSSQSHEWGHFIWLICEKGKEALKLAWIKMSNWWKMVPSVKYFLFLSSWWTKEPKMLRVLL